jgi:hypothetical protein
MVSVTHADTTSAGNDHVTRRLALNPLFSRPPQDMYIKIRTHTPSVTKATKKNKGLGDIFLDYVPTIIYIYQYHMPNGTVFNTSGGCVPQ